MKTRELESLLTLWSGYQPGEIDQRTRPLRDRDLIPHGPRGNAAPDLEPLHVALVVLTMVSRRATDSGEVATRAMDLKAIARNGSQVPQGYRLAPMIAAGIVRQGLVQRVEITCDGAMAWVTSAAEDGTISTVLFTDDRKIAKQIASSPDTYDSQGCHYAGHRFVLTGAMLDQIRLEMNEDEAGYSKREATNG